MNRKLIKILTIILITITVMLITNTVFATSTSDDAKSGSGLAKIFDGTETGKVDVGEGEGILKKVIGPVLSVIRIVATGVSVIMITYLGIKYMSAAPSEKANIKSQLITFTIGAIIVVSTATILDIIKDFAQNSITT